MAPLRSDLESACESLTGNARKIMQVISEDSGITIESLATLVKLTPYGIRCHLAGLAKSVGLHHSSDRKGGVWEVTGSKNRAQETTTETTREVSPQTSKETTIETTQETTIETTLQTTPQITVDGEIVSPAVRQFGGYGNLVCRLGDMGGGKYGIICAVGTGTHPASWSRGVCRRETVRV